MQQKNPADNFFSDIQSAMKKMMEANPAANPFDFKTIMETQRKNFQAITEANQRAMQGWQTLAQRQAEMVSKFVQDNSTLARDAMDASTTQDKFAKQADAMKKAYETSLLNTRELTEILRQSTIETAEVINRRFVAGAGEMKAAAGKKGE